jgi:hypothetical protein
MAGRVADPTRGLLMGSAGLRAGDWIIFGMVGQAICLFVDCTLVSESNGKRLCL